MNECTCGRYTSQEESPPLSLTDFTSDDTNGSSSCRFMRSSMYRVPATADLLGMSRMPLAIAVQPFAPMAPTERAIRTVDFGTDEGPVRCANCRGYINLFCTFHADGKKWSCNLCKTMNKVPVTYECGVDTYVVLCVRCCCCPSLACDSFVFAVRRGGRGERC